MLNDNITKEDLQYAPPTEKQTIRTQVQQAEEGSVEIQYDFAAWYDQFPLGKTSCFFRVRVGKKLYELTNLPMGAKFSCSIAQIVTWALLAFDRDAAVKIATCIDNVRFVGPRDVCLTAAQEFERRCDFVGAQLNEQEKSAADRVRTTGTFAARNMTS